MAEPNRMLVNYVPGAECRVAVVRNGRLDELHAERADSASHVGNIYVGKVMNVEAGIQAAFVDFGLEENGFLHVTDVHPRYFPGEDDDATERVGLKTPRRERPPIQACLKRGQEVIVQVLKEGIGTKGPTLTSYLSVPGRFIVMMPQMDKVGVSRKVEDEEQRREMRAILDTLDLPEGFGFILRTAGMDQTKTELKRDLAYLQRLWKDMQRRLAGGTKPRLLYAESDLLVRALRDVLAPDIKEVIVDDPSATRRAAHFLKIVAPRTGPTLLRYADPCPIFHRFTIEDQIRAMNSREAPLPSGGSLVIDEAEALVAIDVNSGKMRDNRDAETTAFKTNMEAADEIARQLRLRDLGGVVINDFIDMRSRKNQKDLYDRFNANLKTDRAHTKTLPISQFGIIEMTRQRMRGSHRKVHFAECPHCQGTGRVQRPSSVLADALRELAWLVAFDKVRKVELVVAPRIAGELISVGRQRLSRVEATSGKRVDVRVVESAPLDRVTFYAYDDKGDIDIATLRTPKPPADMEIWAEPSGEPAEDSWAADPREEAAHLAKLEADSERQAMEQFERPEDSLALAEGDIEPSDDWGELGLSLSKRRRGRRGGGGGRESEPRAQQPPAQRAAQAPAGEPGQEGNGKRKRRRRRRGRGGAGGDGQVAPGHAGANGANGPGRGDSWDVEPRPAGAARAPAPQRAPAPSRAPAQRAGAPAQPGRGDSWDIEPASPSARADSWDLAPPGVPASPPAPRGQRAAPSGAPAQNGWRDEHGEGAPQGEGEGGGRKRRRRRRGRGRGGDAQPGHVEGASSAPTASNGAASSTAPSRTDSWDVEPAAPAKPRVPAQPVAAQPARAAQPPRAAAAPQPRAAQPPRAAQAPRAAQPARSAPAAPSRADSWDVEPPARAAAAAPTPQPQPNREPQPKREPAPPPVVVRSPSRGDSWDVAPVGVAASALAADAPGSDDAEDSGDSGGAVKKKRRRRGGRGRGKGPKGASGASGDGAGADAGGGE